MVHANSVVVFGWKEAALIPPSSLLNALMDAPMPESAKLTQTLAFLIFNQGLINNFKSGFNRGVEAIGSS